jgi:hypothetical protein
MPGQPRRGTLPVLPLHVLRVLPYARVTLSFSPSVIWPTRASAAA